jgi:hypothetical protein
MVLLKGKRGILVLDENSIAWKRERIYEEAFCLNTSSILH